MGLGTADDYNIVITGRSRVNLSAALQHSSYFFCLQDDPAATSSAN